jgi:small subunit ribosomal protein S8
MTDPIADMLTRIRNAKALSKETVSIPFSKMKYEIIKILLEGGFIAKAEKRGKQIDRVIEVEFKKEPILSGLKRISRPGQRIYVGAKDIRKVKGGYGMAVISTSQGFMSDKEAKKRSLGGEIICEVW